MTQEEVELAEMARRLKSAFSLYYENKYNRKYRPNKRFDTIECWKKVAKVVKHLGAVPDEYIRAQFIYSLGTVFANTLHGPVAQGNWKKFIRANGITPSYTGQLNSVDVSVLTGRIEQTQEMLKEQFGNEFKLSSETLSDPAVKREILSAWWRYDAVVIMAFARGDVDYEEKFFLPACQDLLDFPYLIKAATSIGLDLTLIVQPNEDNFM